MVVGLEPACQAELQPSSAPMAEIEDGLARMDWMVQPPPGSTASAQTDSMQEGRTEGGSPTINSKPALHEDSARGSPPPTDYNPHDHISNTGSLLDLE